VLGARWDGQPVRDLVALEGTRSPQRDHQVLEFP